MHAVDRFINHPAALAGFAIAILYAWSLFGARRDTLPPRGFKPLIRTWAPSAVVILLVIAAAAGLKQSFTRVDFGMFYSSALLLRQDPARLYDPRTQTQYLHAATGLEGQAHYLPFAYPPFVAFLFVPMTALSFRSAYYLMFGINIALFAFTVFWIASKAKYSRDQTTALLAAGSAALPAYAALILGHLTFLGVLLLSLFAIDMLKGGRARTGLWAGLLLFKPTLFPIPLLLLLWKKQWKALAIFGATAFGLLIVSFVLVGWDGLLKNAAMLRLMGSDYLLPMTHSLRGLAFSLHLGTAGWMVMALAVVAALWFTFLNARNQVWALAGAMVAVLLVPPYLQYHDLGIGLVAAAIVIAAINPFAERMRNELFLMVLLPCAASFACLKSNHNFPVMPAALILGFVYCLWKAFDRRDAAGSQP